MLRLVKAGQRGLPDTGKTRGATSSAGKRCRTVLGPRPGNAALHPRGHDWPIAAIVRQSPDPDLCASSTRRRQRGAGPPFRRLHFRGCLAQPLFLTAVVLRAPQAASGGAQTSIRFGL
jgi:hypothetical protein